MADANRRYMNRKGPTDVLSFPAADIPLISPLAKPLGDLMVCMDVVRQNARKHRRLVRIELTHILIHGILHLIGYDHQTPFQNRSMRKKERTLLPRVSPILIGAIRT
jgi:probable rRNA maturation factor